MSNFSEPLRLVLPRVGHELVTLRRMLAHVEEELLPQLPDVASPAIQQIDLVQQTLEAVADLLGMLGEHVGPEWQVDHAVFDGLGRLEHLRNRLLGREMQTDDEEICFF